MSTRITNNMISRSVLADLNDIATRQAATRRQMSSGKAITRPSDDPYAAGRALALRNELGGIHQHARNVDEAQSWMTITDTALGHIGDMAQRARELVVQGATDTLPQTSRDAIASEIDQLIAGMKQEANATYDGRYVLAGDTTSLGTTDMKDLTGQIENLLGVRAEVGASMNRLETAAARLAETEESATSLLSDTEDADMAKTLIDYSTQQAVYQSALNAGARIVQASLLDFLR